MPGACRNIYHDYCWLIGARRGDYVVLEVKLGRAWRKVEGVFWGWTIRWCRFKSAGGRFVRRRYDYISVVKDPPVRFDGLGRVANDVEVLRVGGQVKVAYVSSWFGGSA